ncbi:tetratricopeptide repeat protein [uncultured Sulfitobacter sp.]|uniref:tetratricopeptide repeat protein n=1 Tax=uncultured Sulfitobacter sp. TaxID=191468 RepID=UPI0026147F0D|nr:tetratricopeptide repeat protein [uncultured Sulfitobacter sp.]
MQAAPAKSDAQLITLFERSGRTLTDLPVEEDQSGLDLFSLARAFAKYGNVERALRCIDHIPEDQRTHKHTRFAATQYARVAQFDVALQLLDSINRLDLSGEARRKLDLERLRYLRFTGKLDQSLHIAEELVEAFPHSIETKLAYAELLALDAQPQEAGRIYSQLIANPNHHISVAERYLDFLYEANRPSSSELLYAISLGKFQNGISLMWRQCRHHWTLGNAESFNTACEALAERLEKTRMPAAGIGFFASLQSDDEWPGIAAVKSAIENFIATERDQLKTLTTATLDKAISILNDALVFESEQDIQAFSDAIIAQFPFSARGWYGKGVTAVGKSDFVLAEKAFRQAIELDPSNPEHYNALFTVLATKPGSLKEMEELIAVRNDFVPKFKDHFPDGRARYYDHETFYLNLLRNQFRDAYALRNNQAPNRFLGKHFPEAYRALADDVLPKKKSGTVCVIDQDGVGDEIRWARYYDELGKHFNKVQVSCDPRLVPIFSRSFPKYEFTAVARRWPSVPWRARQAREEVKQISLAGKLSAPFLFRLSEADRIMFPEEVAYHVWGRDGAEGPTEPHTGAYLKPDAALSAEWRETLDADAGGKLKVGLLWRSGLMLKKRRMHYMDVRDFAPLTRLDCHFVSLQPQIEAEEENACNRMGVTIYDDLDLYDDFENIAAFVANLDVVIGISTLPLEMAGAVGTPCWVLNFSNYGNAIRLAANSKDGDINTSNCTVISGDQDGSFAMPQKQLIKNAVTKTVPRLKQAVKDRKTGKGLATAAE